MWAGIQGPEGGAVSAGGRGTSGKGVFTFGRRVLLGVGAPGERACWCGVDGKPPGRGRGVPFMMPCGSRWGGWMRSWIGGECTAEERAAQAGKPQKQACAGCVARSWMESLGRSNKPSNV